MNYAKAVLRAARPSRIVGQGYSQAGIFWDVLDVSLLTYGAQLSLDVVVYMWSQFWREHFGRAYLTLGIGWSILKAHANVG